MLRTMKLRKYLTKKCLLTFSVSENFTISQLGERYN